jgi:hypothetical protein
LMAIRANLAIGLFKLLHLFNPNCSGKPKNETQIQARPTRSTSPCVFQIGDRLARYGLETDC